MNPSPTVATAVAAAALAVASCGVGYLLGSRRAQHVAPARPGPKPQAVESSTRTEPDSPLGMSAATIVRTEPAANLEAATFVRPTDANEDTPLALAMDDVATSQVLVIYTGGTIGCKPTARGYQPAKGFLEHYCRENASFHDPAFAKLTMPVSKYRRRVQYNIVEFAAPLDSANMDMDDWVTIASLVAEHYDSYDGFVILHGTDTLAYTASSLSFLLQNLRKTVVITGSQLPLVELRTDARDNFLGALTIAGHFTIPEVTVYFANKLLRGNRTKKLSAETFDAFDSPNMRPLCDIGVSINVHWELVLRAPSRGPFSACTHLSRNIDTLRLFPGISSEVVSHYFAPPMRGVVIESYGSGNAPSRRKDLLACIRAAVERGVVVVNVTQCVRGRVSGHYETGTALSECGVLPGADMTAEAALCKLAYLLGRHEQGLCTLDDVKHLMCQNMHGELRAEDESVFAVDDESLVKAIVSTLHHAAETASSASAFAPLFPALLLNAAETGDTAQLAQLANAGADLNAANEVGRTALHVACYRGILDTVRFLLERGCNVNCVDVHDRTPLFSALRKGHLTICNVLQASGALLRPGPVTPVLCEFALRGALGDLQRWVRFGADALAVGNHGRGPWHWAAAGGRVDVLAYLHAQDASLLALTDVRGAGALDIAALDAGQEDAVRWLAQAGARLLLPPETIAEALVSAASGGDVTRLRLAELAGYNVSAPLPPGAAAASLMHAAAKAGNASAVVALLHHADAAGTLTLRDSAGHTPAALARAHGHASVAELLADAERVLAL